MKDMENVVVPWQRLNSVDMLGEVNRGLSIAVYDLMRTLSLRPILLDLIAILQYLAQPCPFSHGTASPFLVPKSTCNHCTLSIASTSHTNALPIFLCVRGEFERIDNSREVPGPCHHRTKHYGCCHTSRRDCFVYGHCHLHYRDLVCEHGDRVWNWDTRPFIRSDCRIWHSYGAGLFDADKE